MLEAYTPEQVKLGTDGPPVTALTMSLDALHDELQGLVFRHAVELERDVVEGQLHSGKGAAVQVIAVKP